LQTPTEQFIVADGTGGGENALVDARLRHAFKLCLARQPSDKELARIRELYDVARTELATDDEAARRVAGTEKSDKPSSPDAAAWTIVARTLLNLDEFITRE
jgi:hypothetical protein